MLVCFAFPTSLPLEIGPLEEGEVEKSPPPGTSFFQRKSTYADKPASSLRQLSLPCPLGLPTSKSHFPPTPLTSLALSWKSTLSLLMAEMMARRLWMVFE